LIERRAFWPFLFDDPTQQPVRWRTPYRRLAGQIDGLPDHRALAAGQVDLCGYDDVLVLDAGGEPDLAGFAGDRLQLLAQTEFAALFRIRASSQPAHGGHSCGSGDGPDGETVAGHDSWGNLRPPS
jgi:hypothetical protein